MDKTSSKHDGEWCAVASDSTADSTPSASSPPSPLSSPETDALLARVMHEVVATKDLLTKMDQTPKKDSPAVCKRCQTEWDQIITEGKKCILVWAIILAVFISTIIIVLSVMPLLVWLASMASA